MIHDPTDNDPRFVQYFEQASGTEQARERALGIMQAVIRTRRDLGQRVEALAVADIGCNAGTQSRCWLESGHSISGLDISAELVRIAGERNADFAGRAQFAVGTATELPWDSESFDVCLLPELLEHVEDWESCLREAIRVLRRGGTIFLSTTNVLCPVQQEFALPGYSWYPAWLKRRIVRRSLTTHRHWVNYAAFPAFHWFSPYQLKAYLRGIAVESRDRFDAVDLARLGFVGRSLIRVIRAFPPLRLAAHCATPGTTLIGTRTA
ncbi:MAG: class I SAM-dependent methyltransferase [Gammaproteobacteria bacterium]